MENLSASLWQSPLMCAQASSDPDVQEAMRDESVARVLGGGGEEGRRGGKGEGKRESMLKR